MNPPRSYLPGLDGVRALAVGAVVWHHTHPGYTALPAFSKGFLGVDVFFVLSGFLITTLLLREKYHSGKVSLTRFYMRRTLRIFPLYYAVLAVLTAYFLLTTQASMTRAAFLSELPYHLTYTSNWVELNSFMAITWSLATEEQFYLLWPPIFALLGPWALAPILIFLVLNQLINFGLLDGWLAHVGIGYHEILQTTFTPIILGVLLAYALFDSRIQVVLKKFATPMLMITVALLTFAVLHTVEDIRGWPRLSFHVAVTMMLAGVVLQPSWLLVRTLEWQPLRYVGGISYGVYLLHMIVLDAVMRVSLRLQLESAELVFALTLTATIFAAAVSFRYFETPLLRLKSRYR